MTSALLLLLVALAGSAMFAGSETGFYGINRLRLRHEARRSKVAALLEKVVRSPSAFLATLLIGNNLANDAAVKAAGRIGTEFGLANPEFVGALFLTPLVFLFGEVLPKQLLLASPRRLLGLAAPLALCRVLFWPLTAPLAALARFLDGGGGATVLARRQFEALLQEGASHAPGEARVMAAALRAMDSRGKGLHPFLRFDLLTLTPDCALGEAQRQIADRKETMALLHRPQGPPALLLGSRLALAEAKTSLDSLALPLPRIAADLDLAGALSRLRVLGVAFAWVEKPEEWAGLCDLEYALAHLLAPTPSAPTTPSPSPTAQD